MFNVMQKSTKFYRCKYYLFLITPKIKYTLSQLIITSDNSKTIY